MRVFIFLLLIIFLFCCKKGGRTEQANIDENSINLKKGFKKLRSNLNNGDTILFDLNLAMEQYIRVDTLFLIKAHDKIFIHTKVNHRIEDLENDFSSKELNIREYFIDEEDSLSLEFLFNKNMYRVEKENSDHYLVSILHKEDTLYLYSYNLSDKAKFIKQYFQTMRIIYPNEEVYMSENGLFPQW